MINAELTKISDWLAVNKLSLNASKTKFMVFHSYQRTLAENDIPQLMINNTIIEKVNEFNFLGLTINEFLNWRPHSAKIVNKISRTLGVMNKLKRYLPFSAMKLMYDSLVLSHLQFGISCWGFERDRILKLQKRALRILTDSKYNAHTEPLFKELKLLKVKDIFNVQCWNFWYKFVNGMLPDYFRQMFIHSIGMFMIFKPEVMIVFTYSRVERQAGVSLWDIAFPNYCMIFLPRCLRERKLIHIYAFVDHVKSYLIDMYNDQCSDPNCYVCSN